MRDQAPQMRSERLHRHRARQQTAGSAPERGRGQRTRADGCGENVACRVHLPELDPAVEPVARDGRSGGGERCGVDVAADPAPARAEARAEEREDGVGADAHVESERAGRDLDVAGRLHRHLEVAGKKVLDPVQVVKPLHRTPPPRALSRPAPRAPRSVRGPARPLTPRAAAPTAGGRAGLWERRYEEVVWDAPLERKVRAKQRGGERSGRVGRAPVDVRRATGPRDDRGEARVARCTDTCVRARYRVSARDSGGVGGTEGLRERAHVRSRASALQSICAAERAHRRARARLRRGPGHTCQLGKVRRCSCVAVPRVHAPPRPRVEECGPARRVRPSRACRRGAGRGSVSAGGGAGGCRTAATAAGRRTFMLRAYAIRHNHHATIRARALPFVAVLLVGVVRVSAADCRGQRLRAAVRCGRRVPLDGFAGICAVLARHPLRPGIDAHLSRFPPTSRAPSPDPRPPILLALFRTAAGVETGVSPVPRAVTDTASVESARRSTQSARKAWAPPRRKIWTAGPFGPSSDLLTEQSGGRSGRETQRRILRRRV
jgi:hypothetical protein